MRNCLLKESTHFDLEGKRFDVKYIVKKLFYWQKEGLQLVYSNIDQSSEDKAEKHFMTSINRAKNTHGFVS